MDRIEHWAQQNVREHVKMSQRLRGCRQFFITDPDPEPSAAVAAERGRWEGRGAGGWGGGERRHSVGGRVGEPTSMAWVKTGVGIKEGEMRQQGQTQRAARKTGGQLCSREQGQPPGPGHRERMRSGLAVSSQAGSR